MTRLLAPLLVLAACQPSPVGNWVGTTTFTSDNGLSHDTLVFEDGQVSATIYALEPDSYSATGFDLVYDTFDGPWIESKGVVEADLQCTLDNCDRYESLSCTFGGPGLECDATPDLYADDLANLQFDPQ